MHEATEATTPAVWKKLLLSLYLL